MDCIVPGVAKSWTLLSDFHFHFFHLLLRAAVRLEGEDRHTGSLLRSRSADRASARADSHRCSCPYCQVVLTLPAQVFLELMQKLLIKISSPTPGGSYMAGGRKHGQSCFPPEGAHLLTGPSSAGRVQPAEREADRRPSNFFCSQISGLVSLKGFDGNCQHSSVSGGCPVG